VLLKPYVRVLRRLRREGRELLEAFPLGEPIIGEARRRSSSRCSARSCACGTSSPPSTTSRATTCSPPARSRTTAASTSTCTPSSARRARREGGDQRRRRLRDRAHQAGRDQRRLHPHARPRKWRDERGNGDDKEMSGSWRSALRRLQPDPAQQEGPHRGLRRPRLRSGEVDEEWRAFVQARRAAELEAIITDENLKPDETRAFVDHAFRDGAIPTDRHGDHQDPSARSPASQRRW
jgi:type I restriction enzyme R subunit